MDGEVDGDVEGLVLGDVDGDVDGEEEPAEGIYATKMPHSNRLTVVREVSVVMPMSFPVPAG